MIKWSWLHTVIFFTMNWLFLKNCNLIFFRLLLSMNNLNLSECNSTNKRTMIILKPTILWFKAWATLILAHPLFFLQKPCSFVHENSTYPGQKGLTGVLVAWAPTTHFSTMVGNLKTNIIYGENIWRHRTKEVRIWTQLQMNPKCFSCYNISTKKDE